ncbi:helix-turn-helix domain-containing protein [Herbaspirillum lusitanum]|uniref:helix-turn-helix domain-containing protein n=2 Tax=Herbaspirillum lusitanum TaxID=213312 RepID=UPI002237E4D7|nr:helix-turn-helix domain-containing protein [Herbaspirillum lusitanum]MCW5298915.1 helix-turn-helix domain-containing protein [Herbaspirillum lusitanum]
MFHHSSPPASPGAPPLHIGEALRTVVAHDVDEHAHNLTNWEQRYDQITHGRFCGELNEWQAHGLQIFRERSSRAVLQSCCVWPDAFWFGIEPQARGMRINGRNVGAGMIMTQPGHREFELMTPDDHEILGIVIQRNTLLAAADRLGCRIEWSRLAAAELLHVGQDALLACAQHIQTLLDAQAPQGAQAMQQDHVITTLLAMLDAGEVENDACTSLLRRRRIVGDARDYAMDNQDVPITISMLCEQLHVSRRTLQYCFEDVLGISPMTYLRSLRLNGVRRQLMQGAAAVSPHAVRVGDVAAAWGFSNFSQFSCDYKKLFGESPSSALRAAA